MLQRTAEDELARVQHEGVIVTDRHQLGEPLRVLADIDVGHAVVAKDQDVSVEVQVHGGGLDAAIGQRLDDDAPPGNLFADGDVTKYHVGPSASLREVWRSAR